MKNFKTIIFSVLFIFLVSCSKNVIVTPEVKPQPVVVVKDTVATQKKYESIEYLTVPSYLATPVSNSKLIVPIIIINWIPSKDGVIVDSNVSVIGGNQDWGSVIKYNMSVKTVNQWILSNDLKVKYSIEEGSKFRGFNNPNASPYVGIKIVKYINVYEMPLKSPDDNKQPAGTKIPDYDSLFKKLNLRELVESQGVKEVWLNWTNTGGIWVPESNMASPTTGDISNSYKRPTDLPIYNKTYVVYGASFDRWFAEMVHCRGHQIEAQMSYLNNNFFWQEFVGYPKGDPQPYKQGGRSGSTHFTPNSTGDYDYSNTTDILSDIGDWSPSGNGKKILVNKNTWTFKRTAPFQVPTVDNHKKWNDHANYTLGTDPQSGWLIYWFQSIPNSNNNTLFSKHSITISQKDIDNSTYTDTIFNNDRSIKKIITIINGVNVEYENGFKKKQILNYKIAKTYNNEIFTENEIKFYYEDKNKKVIYTTNSISVKSTSQLENWWDIFYNWDDAIKNKKNLFK